MRSTMGLSTRTCRRRCRWFLIVQGVLIPVSIIVWLANLGPLIEHKNDAIRAPIERFGPTSGKMDRQIPQIFHQHWINYQVPRTFQQWIASWMENHPTWQYWYWTNSDVRRFLKKYYPKYLKDYDSYPTELHKADFMRYFVIHKFGGVYLDLDMESLQPMDEWTYSHGCFVSEETFEHTFFLYNKSRSVVMNCMLACRPQHAFYDLAIKSLHTTKNKKMPHHATGPFFMDNVYLEYKNSLTSETETDQILEVVHPDYFLPTYDPILRDLITPEHCDIVDADQRSLCQTLARNKMVNKPKNVSLANHHWFHVRKRSMAWKTSNTIHIKEIVPDFIVPSEIFWNLVQGLGFSDGTPHAVWFTPAHQGFTSCYIGHLLDRPIQNVGGRNLHISWKTNKVTWNFRETFFLIGEYL